jgi:hypothetical protein
MVRRLHPAVTMQSLLQTFGAFGSITGCKVSVQISWLGSSSSSSSSSSSYHNSNSWSQVQHCKAVASLRSTSARLLQTQAAGSQSLRRPPTLFPASNRQHPYPRCLRQQLLRCTFCAASSVPAGVHTQVRQISRLCIAGVCQSQHSMQRIQRASRRTAEWQGHSPAVV